MRIVIGEDGALLREGMARLLEDAGHRILALAADAPSLVAAVQTTRPDMAIIDVRMPPELTDDGARAARLLRTQHPDVAIMLLSQHVETRHSAALIPYGHFGYLLKDRILDVAEFLDALERVAAGGSALDPEVVTAIIRETRRANRLTALTTRELQVLALIAEGWANSSIGRRLSLTTRTVETHVSSIMTKLGLPVSDEQNRRVLTVLAYLGDQSRAS
jgi:DNA-binding NarL/FixJ family response regulator